jgi:hypothetical protein
MIGYAKHSENMHTAIAIYRWQPGQKYYQNFIEKYAALHYAKLAEFRERHKCITTPPAPGLVQ